MVLNSSVTYNESKPMSRLDYTVKITDALSKEWLQEKNCAAGISSTGNEETDSKHLKKLPAKKRNKCVRVCVCVVDLIVVEQQNINHLKVRDLEKCVLSVKRVFMDNASYTISTLSDIICQYCCHIYKNVYKTQNTL
jgi:hypothetical protein